MIGWRAGSLIASLALAACGTSDEGAPRCPAGYERDGARAARISARLSSVPEGRPLLGWLEDHVMCFAPEGLGVVTAEGQLLLPSTVDDGEGAARVGHLLVHARDGRPLEDDEDGPCDRRVARALDREAVAHVTEVRLQAALGVRPRRFAFEFAADVLAATPPEDVAIVRRYLEDHPDGAPGIDGLATAYRQRCTTGG